LGYAPDGTLLDTEGIPPVLDVHSALGWLLLAGAARNHAALTDQHEQRSIVGDPTEGALPVAAAIAGLDANRVITQLLRRMATIPFTSER
jgi:magnesium-transporting ATPase (P-type)